MPLSKDEAARRRQLANLRPAPPAPVGNQRNLQHGAFSRAVPIAREKYLAELREEFPGISERRLLIQAHRLAQLEQLAAFTDERGVIRHARRGDIFPAALLTERIAGSFLAEQDRLEQLRREQGTSPAGSLEAHLAAHYGAGVDGGAASVDGDDVVDADDGGDR